MFFFFIQGGTLERRQVVSFDLSLVQVSRVSEGSGISSTLSLSRKYNLVVWLQ